jgi:hypothetical protein
MIFRCGIEQQLLESRIITAASARHLFALIWMCVRLAASPLWWEVAVMSCQ